MIKKLDKSYTEKCKEIIFAQKKISGTKPLDKSASDPIIEKFLSGKENYFIIGYFADSELTSFIMFSFQEQAVIDSNIEKFWIISGLYSTIKRKIFSFNNREIGELFAYSFSLAEAHGYNTFYYSTSKHVSNVFEKKFMENNFMPVNRYNKEIVVVIPKNNIPDNPIFKALLGNEPKPHDMVIKKRVLMPEYRKI